MGGSIETELSDEKAGLITRATSGAAFDSDATGLSDGRGIGAGGGRGFAAGGGGVGRPKRPPGIG
jgi:hypothetical protein